MNKNLKITLGLIVAAVTSPGCFAATDSGVVDQVITKLNGVVGFSLVNGAPNSMAAHGCASGWIGFIDTSAAGYKSVLAAILSAKATGKQVEVITDGCLFNNAWNSLFEVTIK